METWILKKLTKGKVAKAIEFRASHKQATLAWAKSLIVILFHKSVASVGAQQLHLSSKYFFQ